ncbi:hypothetical protein [Burkholderia anthina]|nr:hypothetical protein [Burkholderia anthina]
MSQRTIAQSPLKGKLIRIDIDGERFFSNEHALKICWSPTWCLVLLR